MSQEPTRVEYETRVSSPTGRVRTASVTQAFNQETALSLETLGDAVPDTFTLSLYKNGVQQSSDNYTLHDPLERGGWDVRLKAYTGASSQPQDLGQHSPPYAGLENVPMGTDATLDDWFDNISTFDPNPADSETQARDALATAGITLVVIDGPGIWRQKPEGDTMAFEDTSSMDYLQATLLKTGARWWLTGNVLTIDGSAAPNTFARPPEDEHIITAHTHNNEVPTVEEPDPEEPPDREDYLSQCPDYEPPPGYEPPPKTPETLMQGVFRYPSKVGSGDEEVEYERVNTYNGRLIRTELIETGTINTPTGKVRGVRARSVTTFRHHPMCKEAVVEEVTQTFAAPDMSEAGANTDVEEAEATWLALGGAEMYLASESLKETIYHSSGYLKEEAETVRELELLSLREGEDGPVDFELVYNTRTRYILNEPNANGRWVQFTTERQTESVVVYAKEDPDPDTGKIPAAPARVQRTSRSTSRAEPSDAAPAQLNCSPPEPEDPDAPPETAPCEEKKEHEYQKALQAWSAREARKQAEYESRIANIANQAKRVYSISLGIPRSDLKVNGLYGGALIANATVNYADDGSGLSSTTSLTLWQRL